MKRTIQSLVAASLLAWPALAAAGPVEDFGAAFEACGGDDNAACGAAVWSFIDITGDGRLTVAELSRFLRVAGEWSIVEQAGGLDGAVGGLGLGGAGLDEEIGRAGAVAMAFLTGPFAARLVLDNYDYDGNGMLERAELFADSDESSFVAMVKAQIEQLPQYAALAMMAAMAAQEQAALGGADDAMQPDAGGVYGAPEPEIEVEPMPEPEAQEEAPATARPTFALRNLDTMIVVDGDRDIVVVSGEIVNLSNQSQPAPAAIAQGLDANRQVLKTWRLTPSPSQLGPGESAFFIGRLDDAPDGTADWTVVLEGDE